MKIFKKQSAKALWAMALIILASACSKDKDTAQDTSKIENNQVELVGESTVFAKPGDELSVQVTFSDPGTNAMLVVTRDGGPLKSVPLQSGQTSYTYAEETIPADAEEGDEVVYGFYLANDQNTIKTNTTELNVSVTVYQQQTLGSTSVYAITLPTDGLLNSGVIKLAKNRKYLLSGTLTVLGSGKLTVEEGVELYMSTEAGEAYDIVIEDEGKVEIAGAATNAVIVTSDKILRDADPEPGDWGQFNIKGLGNGSSNGSISYLRLEYCGDRGFRLEDVGSGTTIAYVQAYRAGGEGIMPTNGDVNMKYVVATNCEGGAFRFGDDYRGNVQFAIAQGSEIYGDGEAVAVRETASPVLANFTIVGPGQDVENTHGVRLRAASAAKLYNTVIADFPRRGLRLNDDIEITDLTGPTVFAYSYIFNVPKDPFRDDTDHGNPFVGHLDDNDTFQNPFFNNATGFEDGDLDEPILKVIEGIGTTSYIPSAVVSSVFNPNSLNSFFSDAPFVGAVKDDAGDWTKGWTRNTSGDIHQ